MVAKLLLAMEGVDGESALLFAVAYGHQAVAKLLLAVEGVDPESSTSAVLGGRTWS